MNRLPLPKQYDSELRLAALLTAVGCSRLFVKYTLQAWQLGHLVDAAELLASELVTNAVKATGITEPNPRWTELDNLQLITVRLHRKADSIFIEVWDSDPTPPVMPEQSLDSENGRGLFLVASMSSRWNYYHPRSGGKVVWCELPIQTAALEDTVVMPPVLARRVRRPVPPPAEPLHFMTDLSLLRRVHEGLKRLGDDSQGGSAMR
jgi:anti-sigma regulatory factor (Ser/Thr protein kinase)